MRRLTAIFCAMMLSMSVFGQKVETRVPEIGDWATLFNAMGCELFSFYLADVDIDFIEIREYVDGELQEDVQNGEVVPYIRRGGLKEVDRAIGKINIGFYPSGNDSAKMVKVDLPEAGIGYGWRLDLHGLDIPETNRITYNTRPFKVGEVRYGFVPLILLGSSWWDSGWLRFCGDTEIDPDMSSEILKKAPHYYVIGVNVKNKK